MGEAKTQEGSATAARVSREDIFGLLVRHLRDVVPGLDERVVVGSDRMRDLGANSVDRAEVLMLVMESLALSVPRIELAKAEDIGALASLLYDKLPETRHRP